jgi:hypothetical protein
MLQGPAPRDDLGHPSGKSYAPPVSRAELSSARVGAMLGRSVNTAGWAFFACFFLFLVLLFSSGFSFPFLFSLFFSYNSNYFSKFELFSIFFKI